MKRGFIQISILFFVIVLLVLNIIIIHSSFKNKADTKQGEINKLSDNNEEYMILEKDKTQIADE